MGYTLDDGGFWVYEQPTVPPGSSVWSFIDVLRGPPGPQGETGYGLPGPQGQIGPSGLMGGRGPQGPAGKSAFSQLSQGFQLPCVGDPPLTIHVTDTSWMAPGMLIYLPGAGTYTIVGSPIDQYTVQIVNSGDPTNTPCGTLYSAGASVSQANLRGPVGPQGVPGPQGPQGPQGVAGASVFSTLNQAFTIPPTGTSATAFVVGAAPFSAGQIVYIAGGDYFSVQSVNTSNNSLDLTNLGYLGTAPGTVISVGANVSGTGPQGPMGNPGPAGPAGPQGMQGVAPSGAIMMFGAGTAPAGWLICDGSLVGRTQFPNLFNVISTLYGAGDGTSTFALPDFRGIFPLGVKAGTYALAARGGEATHTLVAAENGVHNHSGSISPNPHAHGLAADSHFHNLHQLIDDAQRGSDFNTLKYATGGPNLSTDPAASGIIIAGTALSVAIANSTGGTPHNNMPPYMGINFIIKT